MGLESFIASPNPVIVPGEVRKHSIPHFYWLARRAPSENVWAQYGWAQQGSLVTLWFRVWATRPGWRVRGLYFPLPEGVAHPDSFQCHPYSDVFVGAGGVSKYPTFQHQGWFKSRSGLVTLRKNSTDGKFSVWLIAKPISASHAWGMIQYYV